MSFCRGVCIQRKYHTNNVNYIREYYCRVCGHAVPKTEIAVSSRGQNNCPCCHRKLRSHSHQSTRKK